MTIWLKAMLFKFYRSSEIVKMLLNESLHYERLRCIIKLKYLCRKSVTWNCKLFHGVITQITIHSMFVGHHQYILACSKTMESNSPAVNDSVTLLNTNASKLWIHFSCQSFINKQMLFIMTVFFMRKEIHINHKLMIYL